MSKDSLRLQRMFKIFVGITLCYILGVTLAYTWSEYHQWQSFMDTTKIRLNYMQWKLLFDIKI